MVVEPRFWGPVGAARVTNAFMTVPPSPIQGTFLNIVSGIRGRTPNSLRPGSTMRVGAHGGVSSSSAAAGTTRPATAAANAASMVPNASAWRWRCAAIRSLSRASRKVRSRADHVPGHREHILCRVAPGPTSSTGPAAGDSILTSTAAGSTLKSQLESVRRGPEPGTPWTGRTPPSEHSAAPPMTSNDHFLMRRTRCPQ